MRPAPLTALAILAATSLFAQRQTGELRVFVTDPAGAAMDATGLLAGQATQVRLSFTANREGRYIIKDLPFGVYRLEISHADFATSQTLVDIHSAIPVDLTIGLTLAPLAAEVTVHDSRTLLDPNQTANVSRFGSDALHTREASLPGRSVVDIVNQQPGFLLEANGVLHPRGSEYNVQYVVDGIPITDNRSPAFAPEMEADDLQYVNVLTGGYPAEYGRKLGGVVELATERDSRHGLHGRVIAQGGSFDTTTGFALLQYGWGRNTFSLSADAARTDRYLDPPVEQNFSNHGSSEGLTSRFERDLTDKDRLRIYLHRMRTAFLVPNELLQEAAGQRQDRANQETMGQVSYQRILSPRWLANIQAMGRDVSAALWSNPFATPILAEQDRGFRETYLRGSVSAHLGGNELKFGGEASFDSLHEAFDYRITAYAINGNPLFDPATPPVFSFAAKHQGRDQAAFVQDVFHKGRFTLSAGLRWDRYSLLVEDSALSPRLGAAWSFARLGLVLRASYDRMFQTPPLENLLLSSSEAARALSGNALFLPVRPSRGNQYEAGFAKSLFGNVRLTGTWFLRRVGNFTDDDVLLNTGVSFPIGFRRANIHGFESKLEIPRWGPLSGYISYSNMAGTAQFPVAGGLFLNADPALLNSTERFPITQDQRNSARGRFRYQAIPRVWMALGASYGSGLPIQGVDLDPATLAQQYGPHVLTRVNLDKGRVRPSFSLDGSLGADVWKHEQRSVTIQADLLNLTGRLNVINFAGLFSGTALGPPRAAYVRLRLDF
jgi:hypothetical protein